VPQPALTYVRYRTFARNRHMDAKLFHQRARDCLRLAKDCSDVFAREALVELATEFKTMARFLEAEQLSRARTAGLKNQLNASAPPR